MTQSRKVLGTFKRNLPQKREMTKKPIKTFFVKTKVRVCWLVNKPNSARNQARILGIGWMIEGNERKKKP